MRQKVNREAFFKESILRISSSLEIEKALYQCYLFFKDFIPLDHLMLMHPDPKRRQMNVLAVASDAGGMMDDRHWHVPSALMKKMQSNEIPAIMIANEPETHFVAKHALSLGVKNRSVLIVRLFVADRLIGSLIFSTNGHHQYNQKHANLVAPLREPFAIALSNGLHYQELIKTKEFLVDDNRYFQNELRKTVGEEIVGADYGLKGVMDLVRQVSRQDSAVLLLGDTGTGKELIAGAIHSYSKRASGPMVKMNCGAISPSLIDTELFGHEKGAFTGAVAMKRGRFERAHQGTLFLDEIGELPAEAQTRLLRVLQEKEIERVGAHKPIHVNVRVIAATHRNLEKMVGQNTFRKDLYYRLMVFPIVVPTLAQRKGDIPALAQYLIQKKVRQMNIGFTPILSQKGLQKLQDYNWPGNVRELENAIEREIILCRGTPLDFGNLSTNSVHSQAEPLTRNDEDDWCLDEVIKNHLNKVLAFTNGQVDGKGGAAELVGVNPSTLRSRMKKLGITRNATTLRKRK